MPDNAPLNAKIFFAAMDDDGPVEAFGVWPLCRAGSHFSWSAQHGRSLKSLTNDERRGSRKSDSVISSGLRSESHVAPAAGNRATVASMMENGIEMAFNGLEEGKRRVLLFVPMISDIRMRNTV